MIRSFLVLCIALAAVLWTPWWVQVAVGVVGVFISPYPFILIIPAIVADVLYASGSDGIFSYASVTICTSVAISIYMLVMRQMRVSHTL